MQAADRDQCAPDPVARPHQPDRCSVIAIPAKTAAAREVLRLQPVELRAPEHAAEIFVGLAHLGDDGTLPFHGSEDVDGSARPGDGPGIVGDRPLELFDRTVPQLFLADPENSRIPGPAPTRFGCLGLFCQTPAAG